MAALSYGTGPSHLTRTRFCRDQAASISLFVEKVGAQDGAAGVAATIHEAVSHERLFVFGELLALEKVQAVSASPARPAAPAVRS